MDQVTLLQCQNAALETELRLVKQQLAEAQSATAHLVSIIGKQQIQTQREEAAVLRSQLQTTRAENVRLEGLLRQRRILEPRHATFPLADPFVDHAVSAHQYRPDLVGGFDEDPFDTFTDPARSDLLSFDNDGNKVVASGWAEVSPDREWEVGASNAPMPPAPRRVLVKSTDDDLALKDYRFPIPSDTTILDAGSREQDPQAGLIDLEEADLLAAPKGPRVKHHFTQWERNYLRGLACFLVDLDEEEYAEKWVEAAKYKGRHSPQDWREYFEKEVLPGYQATQAAAATAQSFSRESRGTSSEERVGLPKVEALVDDVSAGEMLVPTVQNSPVEIKGSDSADDDRAPTLKHDSPREKVRPAASKIPASPQGWMASQRAPRNEVVSGVLSLPNSLNGEAALPACQISENVELVSIDEFCKELNKQQGNISASQEARYVHPDFRATGEVSRQLEAVDSQQDNHSFARDPVPGFVEVGEGKTSGYAFKPDTLESTISSCSETGYTSVSGRPTAQYGNRLPRRNFDENRHIRPRCCHWPWDEEQIFHSNFDHDPSTMRTVMISNLPPGASLVDVLDIVRGGKIISAEYLPLSQMRTRPAMDTNAVMVTFLHADKAHAYAEFCSKNNILIPAKDGSGSSRIKVAHTKTPVRPSIPVAGSPQDRPSRVLFVHDDGSKTAEQVMTMVSTVLNQRNIPSYFKHPLRLGKDDDGVLFFEFASIEDALVVKQAMGSLHWDLGGAEKGFLPDPCERPLQSLLGGGKVDQALDETSSGVTEGTDPVVSSNEEDVIAMRSPKATSSVLGAAEAKVAASWSSFGDLEAAGSFKGSVKKYYA